MHYKYKVISKKVEFVFSVNGDYWRSSVDEICNIYRAERLAVTCIFCKLHYPTASSGKNLEYIYFFSAL